MIAPDNLYSRFVGLAKFVLPLAALGLLSTLFLFGRDTEAPAIPMSEVEQIAREPRIAQPAFSGVADDGSILSLSAGAIRPLAGRPDAFAVTRPRARIDATDGNTIDVTAGTGQFDGRARTAALDGDVRMTTSSGYVATMPGLTVEVDSGRLESAGALRVDTPFGQLTAGRMVVDGGAEGAGARLLFTDGVHLLYRPPVQGKPSP